MFQISSARVALEKHKHHSTLMWNPNNAKTLLIFTYTSHTLCCKQGLCQQNEASVLLMSVLEQVKVFRKSVQSTVCLRKDPRCCWRRLAAVSLLLTAQRCWSKTARERCVRQTSTADRDSISFRAFTQTHLHEHIVWDWSNRAHHSKQSAVLEVWMKLHEPRLCSRLSHHKTTAEEKDSTQNSDCGTVTPVRSPRIIRTTAAARRQDWSASWRRLWLKDD